MAGDILDPITGEKSIALTSPETILASKAKQEGDLRALMDIRSMNNPSINPDELYYRAKQDIQTYNARDLMQDELLAYGARKESEAYAAAMNADARDPASIDRSVNILNNIDLVREHFTNMDGYYNAVLDNYAPDDLPTLRAKQNAVQGKAFAMLEDLSANEGKLDMLIDAVSLVAPDYLKDAADLIDGSVFTSAKDLHKFIKGFQNHTPDEQNVLIEEIVPAMWKAYDGNQFKVAGMLSTLFNVKDSGGDIAFNAILDVAAVGDIYAGIKAGKLLLGGRSLAKRAVDADAIEAAAARQRVASINNPVAEEAIGMKRADAAHTANPMRTNRIDEGASIDGIAGDIDVITRASSRVIKEELMPVTANRLSPALYKSLRKERIDTAEVLAVDPKDIGLQKRLVEINAKLEAGSAARLAEKEISQMRKGIIPARFQTSVDTAVEAIKAEIRTQKKLAAADAKAKTSEDNINAASSLGKVSLMKGRVNNIVDEMLLPEAFTPEEQSFAIAKAQERIQKELNDAGSSITNMSIVERDSTGFKVRINTVSGAEDRTIKFTRDDVGSLYKENEDVAFKQRWTNLFDKIFSPEVLLHTTFPNLVKDATFLGQQTAIVRHKLGKMWKEAEAGLSRKEKFQIDSVLMTGDEEGRVFSIAELRSGTIETAAGNFKFNPAQVESYYAKRVFFDELHKLRSISLKRQLEIEGYSKLEYVSEKGIQKLIGRRKKNFDISDLKATDAVFFPGEVKPFQSQATIVLKKDFYKEQGYEVVELFQPIKNAEGKEIKIALVRRDSKWSDLPDEMLHYQAGYVPRVYNKGYYYVRDMDSVNKEVLYAFPTRDKAKAFMQEAGGNLRVFEDREFNQVEALLDEANAYGGLFTGARKQNTLMVKDGDNLYRPERMSVANATERYVQNISAILPLNEYRATAIERWKNTVQSVAKAQNTSGLRNQHFDDVIDLEANTKHVFETARQYIKDVMKMPSKEEQVTERIILGATNLMQGKKFLDTPRKFLLDNSDAKLSNLIKGQAFNLHMGWFNPRQLFVQMQNASLAMSMNPTKAIPALGDALRLRTLAFMSEDEALAASKSMKYSSDIHTSLREYNKSGMRDSIVRQADFDMNALGIGNSSLDVARKLSKAGRVFFNEGENFSRLISWSIARRKFLEKTGKKALSDKDIITVSQDAIRMQMNMQSENAAWWQNAPGIGVATQFLQVQAKFIESVAPVVLGGTTKWTPKEKLLALAGQLFLYGTVGVPVAEEAIVFASELIGTTPDKFVQENPNWTNAINEGFTGMLSTLFGADKLAPSESFSILAGMDDNIVADLYDGLIEVVNGGYSQEGAIETFTGPSANIMRRFGDLGSTLVLSAKALYEVPSGDVAYQSVISSLDSLAALTSTWSNARKLATLHATDKLFSSRGTLVATKAELGEMNLQTQLGIAFGFQTDIEMLHYKNKESVQSARQFRADAMKDLKAAMVEFARTGNEELYKAKMYTITAPFGAYERMEMLKDINKDAMSGKSALDRDLKAAQKLIFESAGRIQPNAAQVQLFNEERK